MGRVFTIFIALLGIPLLLVNIATMGQAISISFRDFLRWFRKKISNSKICKPFCRYIESRQKKNTLPFWVAILIMSSYLLFLALMVSISEGWDFIDSIYFSVVTLATIGIVILFYYILIYVYEFEIQHSGLKMH